MKIVVQRVSRAEVLVNGDCVGRIGAGVVVLLGVEGGDDDAKMAWGARKVAELRIFQDDADKMNRSLLEVGGSALVISQFTLCADIRKGRRPSFVSAAEPAAADELYRRFIEHMRANGVHTETGVFAAKMSVSLVNEGPVTILLQR